VVVAENNGRPLSIGSGIFHYVSGEYREDGRVLYVNRGIGYVGIPMRINCPPEISRFRLVKA
jgi:predicted MPP superfamily phosphohydrolase